MFIHWGLFSVIGRHGWAVSGEQMPFVARLSFCR